MTECRAGLVPIWLTACALAVLLGRTGTALAGEAREWFDQELTPWIGQQLATHPRFKGQSVRVSAFEGEAEDAIPSALTADLAESLRGALAGRGDVRLAGPSLVEWPATSADLKASCRPDEEAYLVAVEARGSGASAATVRIRVLDVRERQWVPGMVREWQGRLDREELARLRVPSPRADLAGRRDLPFEPGQEDLLAAKAARELACGLLAHPAEDLWLWMGEDEGDETATRVGRLVPQYLARAGLLRISSEQGDANIRLVVRSQALDADTAQLWIAVEPATARTDFPSVRTSVYARAAEPPAFSPERRYAGGDHAGIPGAIELVRSEADCGSADCRSSRAAGRALGIDTRRFDGIELLALTRDGGLSRLDPADCSPMLEQTPVALRIYPSSAPEELVSLYAVAALDAEAASGLAAEFASVPAGCGSSALRGAALRGRLVTAERRLARFSGRIRWQRIDLAAPISVARLSGPTMAPE